MQMRYDGFTYETKITLIKFFFANCSDNGGLKIKGLDKQMMPRSDDVTVHNKGTTLGLTRVFDVQIQVLHFCRTACRISVFERVMGKETGDKKMEDLRSLKLNEVALGSLQPKQPMMCDIFKKCEGLFCVALTNANGVVLLGKVISCERKEEGSGGGKKQ
mmetsp:Transcript_88281/g.285146  ORF Transcript_88281/g.285146 Transcript_88281/m.285146 type:complete len:160 (+) Transcript_88281:1-480(+)